MFLFGFQRFIAPAVIKFLYYLGLLLCVFGGAGTVIYVLANFSELGGKQAATLIVGVLIGTPIALLILRFATEVWLVVFEMHNRLGELRDRR